MWPLLLSLCLSSLILSLLNYILYKNFTALLLTFTLTLTMMMLWFKDLFNESIMLGAYNYFMQMSFKMGMMLFILSEVMFFFSFFWTYFHYMFMLSGELGFSWPPVNISATNYMSVPLLNTLLLLSSGVSLTVSHNYLLMNNNVKMTFYVMMTVLLGVVFSAFQLFEYKVMEFSWHMSCYGSIFFMATGFHGFHVLLGSSMLIYLLSFNKVININSCSYDMIAWYWHFVDVVWIILFTEFYWWSY